MVTCVVPQAVLSGSVVLGAVVAAVRAVRRARGDDTPDTIVRLSVLRLPAAHEEWGRAMLAEIGHVRGRWARWRFALGCAWVPVETGLLHGHRGRTLRAVVLAGVATCVALVAYGLLHDRALLASGGSTAMLLVLGAVLAVYTALVLTLSRGATPAAGMERTLGLAGGLAVGGLLVAADAGILVRAPDAPIVLAVLTQASPIGLAALAALAARAGDGAASGVRTALWAALVSGLVAFCGCVAIAYLTGGRLLDVDLLYLPHLARPHEDPDLVVHLLMPLPGFALGCAGAVAGSLLRRAPGPAPAPAS